MEWKGALCVREGDEVLGAGVVRALETWAPSQEPLSLRRRGIWSDLRGGARGNVIRPGSQAAWRVWAKFRPCTDAPLGHRTASSPLAHAPRHACLPPVVPVYE